MAVELKINGLKYDGVGVCFAKINALITVDRTGKTLSLNDNHTQFVVDLDPILKEVRRQENDLK